MDGKRILIVEDNPDSGTTLKMILHALGYEAQHVSDGESALNLVPSFRPHAVILDLGLPGMQGHDAARRMRELDGSGRLMIIALSGWARESDIERSMGAGIDCHLAKPLDLQALKSALNAHPDLGPDAH